MCEIYCSTLCYSCIVNPTLQEQLYLFDLSWIYDEDHIVDGDARLSNVSRKNLKGKILQSSLIVSESLKGKTIDLWYKVEDLSMHIIFWHKGYECDTVYWEILIITKSDDMI